MIKSVQRTLSRQKEKYRVPRSVRDVIPVKTIYADGIFLCGNVFTAVYAFSDINYITLGDREREDAFLKYSQLINSLDAEATYKITIACFENDTGSGLDFDTGQKGDGLDDIRMEYRKIICREGEEKILRQKYLTVSVYTDAIGEARAFFDRLERDLPSRFSAMGSDIRRLSTDERLKLLHALLRPDDDKYYAFNMDESAKYGCDAAEYICPDSLERTSDSLRLGGTYFRTFFLKDYASYIKDSFLSELTDMPFPMVLSLDILPVKTEDAIREVERKLLGAETNIENYLRKKKSSISGYGVLPYDMEIQAKESREFLNDIKSRDQRMMFGLITVGIYASSEDQLRQRSELLLSASRKHMCQLALLKYQQSDGMKNVMPFGVMPITTLRTLTTEAIGALTPFKVQEINEKGGVYLGINSVSRNPIICNRERLVNQSAMILGVPGSGKSMCAKNFIAQIMAFSKDDILICDPEGEYSSMIRAMNLNDSAVIDMSSTSDSRINAMYMTEGYGDNNSIAVKSEFIMSLIEQIDASVCMPRQKSIIDRCMSETYRVAKEKGIEPTLALLRECLLCQSEKEAADIALSLEMYTKGSLDIFGHEGNVDMTKRITVYDIHALSNQLKSASLLVITDAILNRVTQNFMRGKRTHVFIDEFHVVYENPYSAAFFTSAWRQFRKRNAFPTAITQNVEYLLSSVDASTMLGNSEFIIMLSQSPKDREKLEDLLNISPKQSFYMENAAPGAGIIKYGGHIVPFENTIPKDTRLYAYMSTRPGEGVFGHLKEAKIPDGQ